MHKVVLPIKENPDMISYTHNAFISSILSSDIIGGKTVARYRIIGREENFELLESGCKTEIGEDITVTDDVFQEGGRSIVYTECKLEDALVVKVEFRRKVCAWENISIFLDDTITVEGMQKAPLLYRFGCPSGQRCFARRYEEFLAHDDCKRILEDTFYMQLKRRELKVEFSYSYDGKKWQLIYEDKLPVKYKMVPLSIGVCVESRNDYKNWICCNYIQQYLKSDGNNNMVIDYYSGPVKHYKRFYTNQFLDFSYEYYDYDKMRKFKLWKLICERLSERKYIITEIDHFYIPKTRSYLCEHYYHEVMIYGFNASSKTLNMMGYGKQNIVFVFEMSFKEFEKSLKHADIRFILCKVNPNYNDYYVSTGIIKNRLKDYLAAKDCEEYVADIVPTVSGQGLEANGIGVLKYLIDNEDELYSFSNDIRLSYILCEHKKLMLDRIMYLLKNGILDENKCQNILKKLHENVKYTQIMKNSILANSVGNSRKATMKKIKSYLEKIMANEVEAYNELCDLL